MLRKKEDVLTYDKMYTGKKFIEKNKLKISLKMGL